jgi:CheY-like chemotaxis protein
MSGSPATWTHDLIIEELRSALRNLYDPDELRKNRLLRSLAENQPGIGADLQHTLTAAIESLKPDPSVSIHSDVWRIHHTLSARYIQQFRQSEVAKELGLSLRQMRRQDALAIRALGEALWSRYNLEGMAVPGSTAEILPSKESSPDMESAGREEELHWLEKSQTSEWVDIDGLIQGLLRTSQPLARTSRVNMSYEAPEKPSRLFMPLTTTRQALLSVLTAVIPAAADGQITIRVDTQISSLMVTIQPSPVSRLELLLDGNENFEIANRLVKLSGGKLEVAVVPGVPENSCVRLSMPTHRPPAVLVIDDNADTLQLFERYLRDLNYMFIGTNNPEEAVALAEKNAPCLILLDVMLPGVDGWELLARLREHPKIRRIPVVVSTILPQEQLALALGAADFVRKPVGQAALLALLRRLTAPGCPESG